MHHASDDGPPPRFPHADRRIVLADFFAGCGGASLGFAQAGITPAVAVDSDADAAATYRHNFPAVTVIERDIRRIPADDTQLAPLRDTGTVRLFAGCAPCQPFAAHQKHATTTDHRNGLLMEFLRFIRTFEPELVFVENVAGMARRRNTHSPFHEFVRALSETHHVAHGTVTSADYGVPQIRRRLILIASTLGHIDLPPPTHGRATQQPHSTVRDWIHAVPPIAAGQQHPHIAAHRASNLSATNMTRIRATPIGGDRRDWPPHLWADCHTGPNIVHSDAYGRMHWDRPAPALTTRCVSFSNGRYGHPSHHRAITAHEAALLQTFPTTHQFVGNLNSQARQIGNAVPVPVLLARRYGEHLAAHARRHTSP